MAQMMPIYQEEKRVVPVPEWVYFFTDEQFVIWCKQHKLQVSTEMRAFPEEERAAIFRYMIRKQLVN